MQRLPHVRPAGGQALELHQLDDEVSAAGEARLFEQSLLGADIERRDLGDGIDQHLIVQSADRFPIDRKTQGVAKASRLALDICPLGDAQRRRLFIVEGGKVYVGLAIGGADIRFGMAVTSRIGPLKDKLMNEARGTSGDLPLLLRGLPI